MKKYSVAIVGAGSIGAMKPDKYDSPKTKNILTHAHAVHNHKRTELKYIIDNDNQKAMNASAKWNCRVASTLKTIQIDPVDIAILSTPTPLHHEHLQYIMKCTPTKLIIAEKPFCNNLQEAEAITRLRKRKDVPIMVDYIRRYDPAVSWMKEKIEDNTYGKVQHCRLVYTRGAKHEACHAIDLFNYWFGKNIRADILNGNGCVLEDRNFNDPTYAIHLSYEKCNHVFMCPADGREFSIFEIDLLFDNGRIIFSDHGTKVLCQRVIKEPTYGDYLTLDGKQEFVFKTGLKTALYNLIDNAVKFLDGKEDLKCIPEDAINVYKIYDKLGI